METVCYLCGGSQSVQNYTGELYDCPECKTNAEIERLKAELAEAKAFVQDVASADFTATDLKINGASQWRKEAQALVSSWNSTPQDSASTRDK